MLRLMLSESWAEKPASPIGEFLSDTQLALYKSTLRFLLSKFLLQVINFINFSKYLHLEKQRTQDYGVGGRAEGNLTPISPTLHAMGLTWPVGYCMYNR